MPLPEFVRVRDKRTGHQYSTRFPHPEHHEVLDQPAVDANGRSLPAKPHVQLKASRPTSSKEK